MRRNNSIKKVEVRTPGRKTVFVVVDAKAGVAGTSKYGATGSVEEDGFDESPVLKSVTLPSYLGAKAKSTAVIGEPEGVKYLARRIKVASNQRAVVKPIVSVFAVATERIVFRLSAGVSSSIETRFPVEIEIADFNLIPSSIVSRG